MGLAMNFALLIYTLLIVTASTDEIESKEIVIVVLSQEEPYNEALATSLETHIKEQAISFDKESPKIFLTHRDFFIQGSWMITPFLKYIKQVTASEIKWFFFCLENTMVQLEKLLNVLGNYNSSQNLWIGQTLFDQEPSIIHHFAIKKTFKYPLLASGFAMTSVLMQRLIKHIESYKLKNEFSIDMAWEFAKFVLDSSNTKLTHESKLCIVSTLNCATYVRYLEACNFTILPEHTYFAVKTCAKYHTNRIPVIKNTWAKNLINIGYFSDVAGMINGVKCASMYVQFSCC